VFSLLLMTLQVGQNALVLINLSLANSSVVSSKMKGRHCLWASMFVALSRGGLFLAAALRKSNKMLELVKYKLIVYSLVG